MDTKSQSPTIADIKIAFPLLRYFGQQTGLPVRRSTNNIYVANCPFCDGKRTFWIGQDVCGCHKPKCIAFEPPMDVINFAAQWLDMTNDEAIEYFQELLSNAPKSETVSLSNINLWDLPDWLEARGLQVAGYLEWRIHPDDPSRMTAYLPVRPL